MSIRPESSGESPSFLSREVEALAVAEFFHNLSLSAAAAFFGTLLCTAVFMEDGLQGRHVAWLAYGSAVTALRLGLSWAIRRQSALGWQLEPRQWARLAVLGNVLAGIQWGLLGTWLFPEEPGFRQTFTIMVITSFVGGSITAYAPVRWAHPALSIPAAVPSTVYIFFFDSGPHPVSGFMAFFFVGMVLFYAFRETEAVAQRLRADTRIRQKLRDLEENARLIHGFPGSGPGARRY